MNAQLNSAVAFIGSMVTDAVWKAPFLPPIAAVHEPAF
jgi:hypothetical protein